MKILHGYGWMAMAVAGGLMLGGCGQPGTGPAAAGGPHATVKVSEDTFQAEVLDSTTPVVVDFWASWCGPCLRIAPALETLATEFDGKIKVCKVNVDENQELSTTYQIRSIPALLAFKDGKLVDQRIGSASESDYREWFNELL